MDGVVWRSEFPQKIRLHSETCPEINGVLGFGSIHMKSSIWELLLVRCVQTHITFKAQLRCALCRGIFAPILKVVCFFCAPRATCLYFYDIDYILPLISLSYATQGPFVS